MENTLIIFIKNPRLGKVKTRLAATLGKEKALEIYLKLLSHTRLVALATKAERNLFYSDYIDNKDEWDNELFIKHLQDQNPDLGHKMFSAFMLLKSLGKKKVMIIGSDCLELTPDISNSSFKLLDENDAIIGPATDGGYYSVGFNLEKLDEKVLIQTFLNKKWSHNNVCLEATNGFEAQSVSFALLPTLSDVDVADDVLGIL